jgi:hypothetical protein
VHYGNGFAGSYLPEIYRLGSQFKVNRWTEDPPGLISDAGIVTQRAVLRADDIRDYNFPEHIQFERIYER